MDAKSRIQELADDVKALRRYFRIMWRKRMVYVKYIAISLVLALVVAFSIPKTYSSSVVLAPEQSSSELGSGLAGLASMAGVSLPGMSSDAYTVDLYPSIVSSVDFTLALGGVKVYSDDLGFETTYSDYLLKNDKMPWWNYPIDWVKSWMNRLMGNSAAEISSGPSEGGRPSPRFMSKKDYAVSNKIQEKVRCAVEKMSGVISVSVIDHDPVIAAIMADSVVTRLNNFILNYRTGKARKEYDYTRQLCDSARKSYLEIQDKYVAYASTHNSIYSPASKAEIEFLENEVALAYQSYNAISSQLQIAQAKILESTPVYTVVESAYVPLYADSPKKIVLLFIFVVLAFAVATFKIFYAELFSKKR